MAPDAVNGNCRASDPTTMTLSLELVAETVGEDSRCIMSTLQYESQILTNTERGDCYVVQNCDSLAGTYEIIVTN